MRKVYLGDAVYAEVSSAGELILTTSDGISNTNTIVLEREVYEQFQLYVPALFEYHEEELRNQK